jgi:glutamate dehydrogenase/leucine dehydrogenase
MREKNRDVLILSALIQDHFKQSNTTDFDLNEIIEKDTLRRIQNNFEKTELKLHGGYISVFYKRTRRDNVKIELTENEQERFKLIRVTQGDISGPYDGEIRFDFGERFYRVKEIQLNKDAL